MCVGVCGCVLASVMFSSELVEVESATLLKSLEPNREELMSDAIVETVIKIKLAHMLARYANMWPYDPNQ